MKRIFENWRKNISEASLKKVDLSSFEIQDDLNREVWAEGSDDLPQDIRDRLVKIAEDFFEELGLPSTNFEDITITGSLANYNWSIYSDIDLHIMINFRDIDHDIDMVREFFNARKALWNIKHDIMIRGFEVEIYVQDTDEPHVSTGVYSVMQDEWLTMPKRAHAEIDSENVKKKALSLMDQIDRAQGLFDEGKYDEALAAAKYLRKKIKRFRSIGLEGEGEYSVENIAFKALRRNKYLLKLSQLNHDAYDKKMSIKEGEVVDFPGEDPLKPRKSHDPISYLNNKELLALAGKQFPPKPSQAPPKIEPGSPEEQEYEKLVAPRTPVSPEEEQYSDQTRAEMIVWTYEQGAQDEISYRDYLDAKLILRRSAKHSHLQTHKGGKEV
jgi:hypothetical protein